jgi:hypothetical protein
VLGKQEERFHQTNFGVLLREARLRRGKTQHSTAPRIAA